MYRTDWFRSQISVREGRIISLEPSNMPTRRVRTVERRGPERRREFAQDVTADAQTESSNEDRKEESFAAGA